MPANVAVCFPAHGIDLLPLLEPTQLCTNVALLSLIMLLASLDIFPQSSLRL